MTILVNDESRNFEEGSTLHELIQTLNLAGKRGIAVAVNEAVVARSSWSKYALRESDRVTIIQATQGG